MPGPSMLAQVQRTRARVGEIRATLRSPTAEEIGGCVPLLEEAIACLRAVEAAADDRERWGEAALEMAGLQFELGVVGRLIEGGAAFYQGWARVLATAAAGYTPAGEPAALNAPGSVSVQG
jgi:hypothetical protein